jgi:hypothetical protein
MKQIHPTQLFTSPTPMDKINDDDLDENNDDDGEVHVPCLPVQDCNNNDDLGVFMNHDDGENVHTVVKKVLRYDIGMISIHECLENTIEG